MVSGPLVVRGEKNKQTCVRLVHVKNNLSYVYKQHPPIHTYIASYKHISANSQNTTKGTHRSKKTTINTRVALVTCEGVEKILPSDSYDSNGLHERPAVAPLAIWL